MNPEEQGVHLEGKRDEHETGNGHRNRGNTAQLGRRVYNQTETPFSRSGIMSASQSSLLDFRLPYVWRGTKGTDLCPGVQAYLIQKFRIPLLDNLAHDGDSVHL